MSRPTFPIAPVGAHDLSSVPKAGTVFPSASRAAATYTSGEIVNGGWRGVRLFVNITTNGGGTLTVKVQVKDPVSGAWADLAGATTAGLTADALTLLTVYPGVTETTNVDVETFIGHSFRVVATVATQTMVFSVGAELLP